MPNLSPSEQYIYERAQRIMTLKTEIAKKNITIEDFRELLTTLSPRNTAMIFNEVENQVDMPKAVFSGDPQDTHHRVSTPGFELHVPISNPKVYQMLRLSLPKLQHYPDRVSFDVSQKEGKLGLTMRTEGAFFAANFRSPLLSVGVDMSRFIKHTLFKSANLALSDMQIYQYDPRAEYSPAFPVSRQRDMNNAHFQAAHLAKVYFGQDNEVQQTLLHNMTTLDRLAAQQRFSEAVDAYPNMLTALKDILNKPQPELTPKPQNRPSLTPTMKPR